MKQKWEIIHWPNNKRVELCESRELAENLLHYYGKGHIIKETWFCDDGTVYKTREK